MGRIVAAVVSLVLLAPSAGAEEPLAPFFEALRGLEQDAREDHVRVGWWGDSAIVSDGYTGEVRRRLQARFGDGGPGFLLAAPSFSGYLRDGVRMGRSGWTTNSILNGSRKDGLYGYGGVVASSWGGASSTYTSKGEPFERVRVFYRAQEKSGGLQLFSGGDHEPVARLDTAAEEEQDAVWSPSLPSPAEKLRVRASGQGLATVYGVVLEREEPGIVVDPLGVLGLRARRWDKADGDHVKAQVAARGPELLVVNFGGNERVDPALNAATHAEEIADFLRTLEAGAPDAACLVMGPIAHGVEGRRLDPRLEPIYQGQRRAARELGCAFFDTVEAMGGDDAIRIYRDKGLIGGDLAHLTRRGHEAMGALVAEWLLERYDRWKDEATATTPAHSSDDAPGG